MSLDIGDAIKNGFSDALTRNGLLFAGVTYVLTLLSTAGNQSIMSGFVPSSGFGVQQSMPLAFGGPVALWGLVSLLSFLATILLTMGIIRSFANRETKGINGDYFRRNALMTGLNLAVGGIAYGLAVVIGLFFLVVPGIFLAVSLIFWNIYVAEKDQNFVEAFSNSWELSKGNRLDLFLLGLGVLVIGIVIGIVFGIPSMVLGFLSPAIGVVISNIGSAFATVFGLATLVNAWKQLQ